MSACIQEPAGPVRREIFQGKRPISASSAFASFEVMPKPTHSMMNAEKSFLLKQTSAHDVCRAVREIHGGKTFFSDAISRRLSHLRPTRSGQARNATGKSEQLTSREMEVLQLIAEGKANKQSASELGIGIKTVEKHREHLMQKLDIHDTAGLTRYAISMGIIETRLPA